MKIAVLGATQGIGNDFILQALEAKHQIIALARNPAVLHFLKKQYETQLTVVKGDSTIPADVENLISLGADVVVSALGARTRSATTLIEDSVKNILNAMKKYNVKRFILVTSAAQNKKPIAATRAPFFYRRIIKPFFLAHLYKDMDNAEAYLFKFVATEGAGIEYTIVRPVGLVNHPVVTQDYSAVEEDTDPKGLGIVGRKDVAHFMMKVLEDTKGTYANKGYGVSGTKPLSTPFDPSIMLSVAPISSLVGAAVILTAVVGGSLGGIGYLAYKNHWFSKAADLLIAAKKKITSSSP